jgi:hypothetical protein
MSKKLVAKHRSDHARADDPPQRPPWSCDFPTSSPLAPCPKAKTAGGESKRVIRASACRLDEPRFAGDAKAVLASDNGDSLRLDVVHAVMSWRRRRCRRQHPHKPQPARFGRSGLCSIILRDDAPCWRLWVLSPSTSLVPLEPYSNANLRPVSLAHTCKGPAGPRMSGALRSSAAAAPAGAMRAAVSANGLRRKLVRDRLDRVARSHRSIGEQSGRAVRRKRDACAA